MADKKNPELDALMELERRSMAGDPSITPDIAAKVKTKMDTFRAQGLAKPLKGAQEATDLQQGDYASLIDTIDKAHDAVGMTTSGIGGSIMGSIPGTSATDLSNTLTTLKANLAFDKLQDMRAHSPTGGAVGQVSDTEQKMLGSAVAALDQSQSGDQLKANIQTVRDHYIRYMDSLGLDTSKYKQSKNDLGAGETGELKFNDQIPDPVGWRMSEEQQAGFSDFVKANKANMTTGLLQEWAKSHGLPPIQNADAYVKGVKESDTPPTIPDYRNQDDAAKEAARKRLSENGVDNAGGAALMGAGDTASLGFLDEAAGGVKALYNGKSWDQNTQDIRAEQAVQQEDHFPSYTLGQLAGGAAIPVGSKAKTIGEMAKVGGGLGAAYGIGSGTDAGSRFRGGVMGGGAGAATGMAFAKLGDIWRGRGGPTPPGGGPPTPPPPDNISDVAGRLGIKPTPATTGGSLSEGVQMGLGNAPGSMNPIRNAAANETEGLASAARDTAAKMGNVTTPEGAGAVIARGARVSDKVAGRKAGDAYTARTAMMGGEKAPVTMGGTQASIANISGDFASNDVVGELLKHPLVKRLEGADAKELTLGEATELLSESRRVLNKAYETKQPGRLINQLRTLEGSIEGDVVRAAQASDAIAGRSAEDGAVAAQRKGDELWSARMRTQNRELKRPLATAKDDVNSSAEGTYRQLFNDMNEEGGNIQRLRKTMTALPRKAKDTFAASAFDDLGKAVPSAQNGSSDAWSMETFMTNWAKKSDEAKKLVFGGRGVDREINDIVRYAERLRVIGKSRNFSNTSVNVVNGSYVTAVVTTFTSATAAAGPAVGAKAAGAVAATYPLLNGVGRVFLKTPALRQWMKNTMQAAVRGREDQVRTLVRRLPSLAAQHPDTRAAVETVASRLLNAMNDNSHPSSVAASDQEQGQK